jgi:hypothetical protein
MSAVEYPDETELLAQGDRFRPGWWTSRVRNPAWCAFLSTLPAEERGYHVITRADFLQAADSTDGTNRLPCALVASYVWGTGRWAFLVGRRARVFRDNDAGKIVEALTDVESTLRSRGPGDAYRSLLPGNRNYLVHLGPSFFTKVLYAIDGSGTEPRNALILDQFVALALNDRHSWRIPRYGPWAPSTYDDWIRLAHSEAARASRAIGRQVRADAVELEYFLHGRRVARGFRA